jgi:hypothetical protein
LSRPANTLQGLDLKGKLPYLSVNTKKSLYFVNTPECRNLGTSTPCPTISAPDRLAHPANNSFHKNGSASLRLLFPNLARTKNFEPYEYTHMSPRFHENTYAIARLKQMLPFGIIYIHTSPCQCAIQTATDIADALGNDRLKVLVRVDDRISTTCFRSTVDRVTVLQSLLAHLDTLEPQPDFPWTALDRTWLDQRLYTLESDLAAPSGSLATASSLGIFSLENDPGPFAGMIIVGEVDFCIPLLQAEPFPWTPRFPRECEVYEITHVGSMYKQKYISKFAPRPRPRYTGAAVAQRQGPDPPSPDAERATLPVGKRSASPLKSGSEKRAKTPSIQLDRRSSASMSLPR